MRTISLPEPLHDAAEELASRIGFPSAAEYIADLVRRGIEQDQKDPELYLRHFGERTDSPPRTKQDIERLLLEGLNSGPATVMTPEDWEGIRQEVRERRAQRKGSRAPKDASKPGAT